MLASANKAIPYRQSVGMFARRFTLMYETFDWRSAFKTFCALSKIVHLDLCDLMVSNVKWLKL